MERKIICGDKFVFGNGTISLPVSLENVPDRISFGEDIFLINDFLHVSLVCIGKIIEKHNVQIPDFESSVVKDFCEFSKKNNLEPVSYTNEYKFAEKGDQKTIIVMCSVPNLNKFFELINKKYELSVEYPPMHVTLYKLEGKRGIFLTDSNDIKNLTIPIPNPLGRTL